MQWRSIIRSHPPASWRPHGWPEGSPSRPTPQESTAHPMRHPRLLATVLLAAFIGIVHVTSLIAEVVGRV